MRYITEIGLTSRFFQAKLAYQLVYHNNSGTLPLNPLRPIVITITHFSLWSNCWSDWTQTFMVNYYAEIGDFVYRRTSRNIMVVEIRNFKRTYLMVRFLVVTPQRKNLTNFYSKSHRILIKSLTNEPWLSSNLVVNMKQWHHLNSNLNSNLAFGNNI